MAFVVRSGTVRRDGGDDVAARRELLTQVVVAHRAGVLADRHAQVLDAAMSELDDYRVVERVDESAITLLHALAYRGKREVLLVLTSPLDVKKVVERVAALRT